MSPGCSGAGTGPGSTRGGPTLTEQTDRTRTFDDRYELRELLGSGGAAEVWRARDHKLGRGVAVKILSGPAARDPGHRRRIAREARALAAVSHPNVVAVYDYGEQPTDGAEPIPYIVMELVEGPDLAHHLAASGPLGPEAASRLLTDILRGVEQGHAAGIVHGDLKPANVFLAPDGAKVGDFGVARILTEETGTTTVAATPTYAAPEVLRGERPDLTADVYSAACVAFEALAGRPPYRGKNFWEVARQHLEDPVPSIREHRPEVPAAIDAAIAAGLAKDPADRPATMAAFAEALGLGQPLSQPAHDAAPTVPVRREPTEVLPKRPSHRRGAGVLDLLRRIPIGLALAALAVLLLLAMKDAATATTRVPDLVGMQFVDARAAAEDEGFRVDAQPVHEGGVAGTVVRQDPAPAELLERGGAIRLAVTQGAPQVTVPDVAGLPAADARDELAAAGLEPGVTAYLVGTGRPAGTVVRTDPPAGESVDEGTAVEVFVAAETDSDDEDGKEKDEEDEKEEKEEKEERGGPPRDRGGGPPDGVPGNP